MTQRFYAQTNNSYIKFASLEGVIEVNLIKDGEDYAGIFHLAEEWGSIWKFIFADALSTDRLSTKYFLKKIHVVHGTWLSKEDREKGIADSEKYFPQVVKILNKHGFDIRTSDNGSVFWNLKNDIIQAEEWDIEEPQAEDFDLSLLEQPATLIDETEERRNANNSQRDGTCQVSLQKNGCSYYALYNIAFEWIEIYRSKEIIDMDDLSCFDKEEKDKDMILINGFWLSEEDRNTKEYYEIEVDKYIDVIFSLFESMGFKIVPQFTLSQEEEDAIEKAEVILDRYLDDYLDNYTKDDFSYFDPSTLNFNQDND